MIQKIFKKLSEEELDSLYNFVWFINLIFFVIGIFFGIYMIYFALTENKSILLALGVTILK